LLVVAYAGQLRPRTAAIAPGPAAPTAPPPRPAGGDADGTADNGVFGDADVDLAARHGRITLCTWVLSTTHSATLAAKVARRVVPR
jgi:hypothetical protein